jgi:hypothetical protein
MKNRLFVFLISTASALLLGACASENSATQANTGSEESAKGATYLTGSYMRQDVQRSGEITNGRDPVRVLDREKIDRSGASDLKQFLDRQGVQ